MSSGRGAMRSARPSAQYPHSEEEHQDYEIRYRSFGLMQILDMGHPSDDYTRGSELGSLCKYNPKNLLKQ